ncbi:MAG TPA: deoxynucleoside kinase [Nevskiaceae bacterium]|nr:deoxynucleoside kinase [Nevskiaceae bacterium]
MRSSWHLAIEGPIGVGKTTLAQQLARSLEAELLLEQPEHNPFLPRFYRDPEGAALPTQLCFLLQRAGQAEALHQADLFRPRRVADFLFDKDRLFAELTLKPADFALYQGLYERLRRDLPAPDLVLYLHAPVEVLMTRIEQRGRVYEQPIQPAYLERLSRAYRQFFSSYRSAPVIEIEAAQLDLLHQPRDYRRVLAAITAGLPARLGGEPLV